MVANESHFGDAGVKGRDGEALPLDPLKLREFEVFVWKLSLSKFEAFCKVYIAIRRVIKLSVVSKSQWRHLAFSLF